MVVFTAVIFHPPPPSLLLFPHYLRQGILINLWVYMINITIALRCKSVII